MPTMILGAAVNTDRDTGSYFDLAARAARTCVERAGITIDEVGMLINTGVFRDNNLVEPAVAALIQKRLGLGLEYEPGRIPVVSFDLLHGANGLLHGFTTAECFLATGEVKYVLLLAGDAHPSTERAVAGFPYTTSGAAILLGSSSTAGGFGRLQVRDTTGPVEASAWLDVGEAGSDGRSTVTTLPGADPLALAAAAVRACLAEEGLDDSDFAAGRAVLLAPAPGPGFPARLADTLGLAPASVIGVPSELGDPYSAAPVHAYLHAQDSGVLDAADTVLFLAAYDASAVCLPYRPRLPAGVAMSSANVARY
ncbi:hypothetical protein ABZ942_37095 [Nocardia sp. NPDC046473]|uniref:hypothetical protein n=1 Tax=Nocardia sp. NPDC046473 TaxID=3155733 RepID=UPI0033FB3257